MASICCSPPESLVPWRRSRSRRFGKSPNTASTARPPGATPIREFTWMPRLGWRVAEAAGPGWAMLPSAAAFVDPLFSTGIPLTLRMQPGYDHGYGFVATFMEDHLRWHAARLG